MSILIKTMARAPVRYSDPFVARLYDDIGALIEGDTVDPDRIANDLQELAARNNPWVREYWRRTERGSGIPDSAFHSGSLFHFPDAVPVRAFRTSGATGQPPGVAEYSERGLDLMHRSVIANARRHVFGWLDRPNVIRLVPEVQDAPDEIMPYVMALLSQEFGDPATSASIVCASGLDIEALVYRLNRAVVTQRPVVVIGASVAFPRLCDALSKTGQRWVLPYRSRIVDAGGFRERSREVDVDVLRDQLAAILGVGGECFINMFCMTELASQLYDGVNVPIGPNGERPKHALAAVCPRVRDPATWALKQSGPGLVDIADLCVLDRPYAVLTGDWGIASRHGVAITGRVGAFERQSWAVTCEPPTEDRAQHATQCAYARVREPVACAFGAARS